MKEEGRIVVYIIYNKEDSEAVFEFLKKNAKGKVRRYGTFG